MAFTTNRSDVRFTTNGATYTLGNGNVIHYQRFNDVYYHAATPEVVVKILDHARSSQQRIRLYYGDMRTGRDWLDEWDVEGHIGNSIGPLKVPLLVPSRRSDGGPALLDHCIVRIKSSGRNPHVLYQHRLYHTGTFTIRAIGPGDMCGATHLHEQGYTHAVDVDGSNQANFRSLVQSERFVQKMTG